MAEYWPENSPAGRPADISHPLRTRPVRLRKRRPQGHQRPGGNAATACLGRRSSPTALHGFPRNRPASLSGGSPPPTGDTRRTEQPDQYALTGDRRDFTKVSIRRISCGPHHRSATLRHRRRFARTTLGPHRQRIPASLTSPPSLTAVAGSVRRAAAMTLTSCHHSFIYPDTSG
jgi:hypothetical protein